MRPDIHTQRPAELRLLIDLTRGQEDDALPQALSALTAHNDLDWRKITALAEHHRVAGLVAGNLVAHPSAKVPDAIRNYFAERLKAHALRSLALTRATIEVTAALRSAEIPSVLLKGQAVAQRYYRAPNARQSIDIDVLVAERDFSRARSVVAALGFAQSFPSFAVPPHCEDTLRVLACDVGYRRPSDGARLELHWRLQPNPYLLDWKFDVLQSLASEMCLADTRVLVLKPAPQLVYLMCHGAKHAWFRLKWIADVNRIVNALTEEQAREAIQLARCAGVMRMVAASSRLLADIYWRPSREICW
jgi:hypothetical protein